MSTITATATVTDTDYSIRVGGSHHSGRTHDGFCLPTTVMEAVFPYRDDRDAHEITDHEITRHAGVTHHVFVIAPVAQDEPVAPAPTVQHAPDAPEVPPMPLFPSAGAAFYVTVRRGAQTGILAGPFHTSVAATAKVEDVRAEAVKVDPGAHFDGFGVSQVTPRAGQDFPVGKLNEAVGM